MTTMPSTSSGLGVLKKVLGSKPISEISLQDFATERENLEVCTWVKDQWAKAKTARGQIE
jgi:hypothetical protein